jgi:phosphinothricin acetyltransferase
MSAPVRLARAADAEQIEAIYAPIVLDTVISFETEAPDAAELRRRLAATLETHPWLVHEEAGEVLGYAYASRHHARRGYRWAVDVSAYVRADARRRGLAGGLYRTLFELLALQGYVVAYAGITLPNAWHDVGWWQRPLRRRDPDPAEPRPPAELAADPRWLAAFERR